MWTTTVDLFPWEKSIAKSHHKGYAFCLTKPLRILFLTIFLMKQLHLMTVPWSYKKAKQLTLEKMKCVKDMLKERKTQLTLVKNNSSKLRLIL